MNTPQSLSTCRKILFCTDFAPDARSAFVFAAELAQKNFPNSTLYILHTIPEAPAQFWKGYIYGVDEDVDAAAKQKIDETLREEYFSKLPAELPVKWDVRIGEAGQSILAYAAEQGADLIVLGRQGKTKAEKLLFGNVIERVIRKSPCPILVIPMMNPNPA